MISLPVPVGVMSNGPDPNHGVTHWHHELTGLLKIDMGGIFLSTTDDLLPEELASALF
jgi:hypothetical protein